MKYTATILGLGLLVSLAGCDIGARQPLGAGFGNAFQHNMAAQIIAPEPRLATEPPAALDGRRSAGAIQRYEKGEVIEPEKLRTTEGAD